MTVGLGIHVEPIAGAAAAADDRSEVFDQLYRACRAELVELCRRQLGGRGDPEAMAQEAFVRAWLSFERFADGKPFWPWLATIARRLCVDHRRRLGRQAAKRHVEARLCESAVAEPEELVEAEEEMQAAVRALRLLKPAEQRVITLRDVNGWSYDEIARFEGVTVESIRASLRRARASLRRSFKDLAMGAPAVAAARRIRTWARGAVQAALPSMPTAAPTMAAGDVLVRALVVVLGTTLAAPAASRPGPSESPAFAVGAMAEPGAGPVATAAAEPGSRREVPRGGQRPSGGVAGSLPVSLGDGADRPEQATFSSTTPSPAYDEDGTIFAVGTASERCAAPACPVLFRSGDRGRSWTRVPARGFSGGRVLLPPSYPADSRIFADGPTGLQVSLDGGLSFSVLAPIAGGAAVSPAFSDGDPRILFAAAPGWEYRDDLDVVKPGGVLLPSTSLAGTVAFAPSYPADRRIVVGGTTVAGTSRNASAVFVCRDGVCDHAVALPGYVEPASVALAPDFSSTGVLFAWRGSGLFVSTDGGATVRAVSLPATGEVVDVSVGPGGDAFVALRWRDGTSTRGTLLRSRDLGASWQALGGGTALAEGPQLVRVLPDGRLLAAVAGAAGGGLLCSVDGGVTWANRCG